MVNYETIKSVSPAGMWVQKFKYSTNLKLDNAEST